MPRTTLTLHRRPYLLAALAVALWMAGCSSARYSVTGRVVDGTDGRPLTEAELQVGRTRYGTDAEGRFELLLGAGDHEVRARVPGYVAQVLGVSVSEEHPAVHTDVSMVRRSLQGTVVDAETGAPVADALLRLGGLEARADGSGAFALDAVERAELDVSAVGYQPLLLPADEVEAHFDAAGHQARECALALAPRVLEGTVTDARSQAPLEGVPVATARQATRTGADGRYRLAYVERGDAVTYGGEAHRPVELPYDGQGAQDVSVEAWRVGVRVRDATSGAPLAGARILVGEVVTTADAEGAAELSVPPGTSLSAELEGYVAISVVYAGEETLDLTLPRSQVAGVLTDAETGQPVAGGLVLVYAGGDEPILVRSGEDGRFELEDVTDAARVIVKAPGYRRAEVPVTEHWNVSVVLEPFEFRGVYITFGLLSVPEKVHSILDLVEQTGMNGIVVDVKGDWARIAWDSAHPVAREVGAYTGTNLLTLEELLEECHRRGLYVIARMVVFKDDLVGRAKPEWAVKRPDGSLYEDYEGLVWLDPFLPEVAEYHIELAKEVAAMGFDEIQLDYLRFPSDGAGVLNLVYSQEANFDTRTTAMAAFCAAFYDAISRTPAFASADIFGLTPWVDPSRDMGIGQRVDDIAPHMDYVSPMLYPTTFAPGELGYGYPGDYPYEIIYHSVLRTQGRTSTMVRPWLQYYSIGRYSYGLREYLEQRKGAEDAGSCGWIFWNARGNYEPEAFLPDAIASHPDLPSPPEP